MFSQELLCALPSKEHAQDVVADLIMLSGHENRMILLFRYELAHRKL